MSCARRCSRSGWWATRSSSSPTISAWRPQREVGLDPRLERGQSLLLEPRDVVLGERLVLEIRQRRAAPQRQCVDAASAPSGRRDPLRTRAGRRPPAARTAGDRAGRRRPPCCSRCRGSAAGCRWRTPSSLRSCDTYTCRLLVAVAVGRSPHSSSISRSAETTSLACSSSNASNARRLPPPTVISRSPSVTSRGPSKLNFTLGRRYQWRASPGPFFRLRPDRRRRR